MAIGTAAAIIGGSIIGAVGSGLSSRSASNAQTQASNQSIAEQRRQFDTILGLQQPALVTGTGALNTIAKLYGLPYQTYGTPSATPATGASQGTGPLGRLLGRGGATASPTANTGGELVTPTGPDMSAFTESPDYQFRKDEGLAAVDRTAAARSGALSGNAVRGAEEFASNLASTEYGNFFNRLAAVAGIGQSATNTASQAASSTGSNISSLLTQRGDARASGIMGVGNSITNAVNSGLNSYMLYRGGYFNNPAPAGG